MQSTKVKLAEAAYDLNVAQLTRQVRTAYADVLVARRSLELYRTLDSVYRNFERAARLRYDVEETSRLAYLAASNQVKQIELAAGQVNYDYTIALAKFNLWFMSDTLFTATTDADRLDIPLTAEDSISAHPLLELAEQRIDVAEAGRKVASAGLFPTLNAQYGVQEIDGESGFRQFQIGISIPLFFGQDQGRIQSAKIEREIAEQGYLRAQLEIQAEYQSVLQEYRKWLASWRFYESEALPLAREQRQGAIIAYREGEIDYVSFIQNLKEAVQVELNAQDALRRYLQSRFQLEYYLKSSHE